MKQNRNGGAVKWILIGISAFFLFLFLILPLIYILSTALREGWQSYVGSVTDPYAVKAILLTLKTTAIALLTNTVCGVFAAWCITKFTFRGKKVLSTLIDLPLSVSPVIAGLALLLTFGRQSILDPVLEALDISIVYAFPGIVIATVFVTFPFVSREIIPVMTSAGTDEEEAAALMGANGWTIFWKVTFPHIKWALLYGMVLCTARAMGEFGAVSVISGHLSGKTNTMPLYIELLYQGYDFTGAFAMSSILVIMAVLVLILKNVLEHLGRKESEE